MITQNENISRAQTMRDEIIAAPDVWLPRRDYPARVAQCVFVAAAEMPSYELGSTEGR